MRRAQRAVPGFLMAVSVKRQFTPCNEIAEIVDELVEIAVAVIVLASTAV